MTGAARSHFSSRILRARSGRSVEIEGGGEQAPGVVRVLDKWPFHLRELITEWVPGERVGYELLEGMRVEGDGATVNLEEDGHGGTVVHWRPVYAKAGPSTALVLRLAVRDACGRVARAASAYVHR